MTTAPRTDPRLVEAARRGDEDAFQAITDPFRRELHLHCYRMLGSFQDAEDLLQETMLAAWRGLSGFEGRASLRTWLYQIATNRCLNTLRAKKSRMPVVELEEGTEPTPGWEKEILWLEPYPDELINEVADTPATGPEARYELREGVALAFVCGLQHLPERQRAVLVLRDVLGFRANEVADLLDTSVASVNSGLQRARAALEQRTAGGGRERAALPDSAIERELAARYADATESGDTAGLLQLLSDDCKFWMPPYPLVYRGLDEIAGFMREVDAMGMSWRMVPTRANGHPAFVGYMRGEDGEWTFGAMDVLRIEGDRIVEVCAFALPEIPSRFGVSASLPE